MKKIETWSFTTVKNEEDIIETFVRYNLNVLSGMVISDNGSTDSTLEILQSLKNEGLNIIILNDNNMYFDQVKIRNSLLKYTFDNTNADFVFPLDCDEFISSNTLDNPNNQFQKMDPNKVYKYELVNYVLDLESINQKNFELSKFKNKRINKEKEDCNFKCIVSRRIYNNGIELAMGAHNIITNEPIKYIKLKNIYLSHYPVRSKEQITNKVIAGRLYNSSLHSRSEGLGFHQYEILDEIIKYNELSNKTLIEISYGYNRRNKDISPEIIKESIYTGFCKNLVSKYTVNSKNKKTLSNTIKISENIIDNMREKYKTISKEYSKSLTVVKNLKKIERKNQRRIMELSKTNDKLEEKINNLTQEINNLKNSTSWKVTKPLRKVSSIIKGNKK